MCAQKEVINTYFLAPAPKKAGVFFNMFLIYYSITVLSKNSCKSFIKAKDKASAKSIFLKKIKKDFPDCLLSDIKIYKINQNRYKSRCISDKNWDKIINYSYPNGKHKLYRFSQKSWFNDFYHNRNSDGTFKLKNIPWNKGLKIKFIRKDSLGKFSKSRSACGEFKKGIKPFVIGSSLCK